MSLASHRCSGNYLAGAAALALFAGACTVLAQGITAKQPPAPPWQSPSGNMLYHQLALVPELDVLQQPGQRWPTDGSTLVMRQFAENKAATAERFEGLMEHVRRHRSDLWGLPFLKGKPYAPFRAEAVAREAAGDKVRDAIRDTITPKPPVKDEPEEKRPDLQRFWSLVTKPRSDMAPRSKLSDPFKGPKPGILADLSTLIGPEHIPEALPALRQLLVVESEEVRRSLVDYLREEPTKQAGATLARLAVFDLEASVRRRALAALKGRTAADYLPVLLDALRHPLLPAAQRAAEALATLKPKRAVAQLVAMLEEPDPASVVMEEVMGIDIPVKRELVRVNHLRNCLLCHPASVDAKDPMRAVVAIPGLAVPQERYYRSTTGTFIRANVTYLRQDFSVMHKVKDAKPWPEWQRYDYLVRTRPLTTAERRAWLARRQQGLVPVPSGQRQALLWALRQLTRAGAATSK